MSNLTLEELKSGDKSGTHKLSHSLVGFKKVECKNGGLPITVIAKVEIPAGAIVIKPAIQPSTVIPPNRKIRTNKLKVIAFYDINGGLLSGDGTYYSIHDKKFAYVKGKTLVPDSFDTDLEQECTNGLHLFLTEEDAKKYAL